MAAMEDERRQLSPTNRPGHVAFSPDGKLLVTVEEAIRLWRGNDFTAIRTLGGEFLVKGVTVLLIANGPRRLVRTTKLWQRKADNEFDFVSEPVILSEDDQMHYDYLSFSPDGKLLATNGGDKKVPIWNVAEKRVVRELMGHERRVTCVAFSMDGIWPRAAQGQHGSIVGR